MFKIQFCPKCGAILVPKKDRKTISCSCGYISRNKKGLVLKEKNVTGKGDRIAVIGKKIEALPKIKEECPKCRHKEAYFWTVQARAADEAETRFFECVKCGHRWRSYS